jgi:hypothetical protein
MRGKIIAVNALIMLVCGVLTYVLLATSLSGVLKDESERKREVGRALRAANAQLALDALRVERWLAVRAGSDDVKRAFSGGTVSARQEAATAQANEIYKAAIAEPDFVRMAPNIVLIVDAQGVALGRNGSNLMRGEKITDARPTLKQTLTSGVSISDLWLDKEGAALVSSAPIRGDDGEVLGAAVIGTPIDNGRLERTSEQTSGYFLALGVLAGEEFQVLASSGNADSNVIAGAKSEEVATRAREARATGKGSVGNIVSADHLYGATPLVGYANRGVLVAAVPASLVPSLFQELWPVVAVMFLGILLVVVAGYLLGNYIQTPISEIEEGLLMIINGRSDLRFELEHAELGGLVFRINSLLNALMGVPEESTDDQGRPSSVPSAGHFQDALSVDESSVAGQAIDPAVAAALAAEPPDQYYARIFREYIAAKQQIGDPVQHITQEAFVQRLQGSEREMSQKHQRAVRYKVEVKGNSVVLIAVPLPQ